MSRLRLAVVAGGAALLAASGVSQAIVLEKSSEEQKVRRDISSQLQKAASCYGKAWQKCEKGTDMFTQSCSVETGESDLNSDPGDLKLKFSAALAKCTSKIDLTKKLKDLNSADAYTAIGCPGDSDTVAPGPQNFADLNAYETAAVEAIQIAVDQFAALQADAINGCSIAPAPMEEAKDTIKREKAETKCIEKMIKAFAGLAKGLPKCQWKCENDYNNKKGNGGPNDDENCGLQVHASVVPPADPNIGICEDKAWEKFNKKMDKIYPGGVPALFAVLVYPGLVDQLNAANNDSYNADNCQ